MWELHPASSTRRYDSLTGVPAQQRALAFEKGSVLFNIGALYTQIGARQDRSCPEGTRLAFEAFQRAAGEGNPAPSPLAGIFGGGAGVGMRPSGRGRAGTRAPGGRRRAGSPVLVL